MGMGLHLNISSMRFLIVASLISLAYSAQLTKRAPRFTLVERPRSSDSAPSVSITFPDGQKDTMVLSRFYANEQQRMDRVKACHYTDHLANELEACVAMTGCVGSEDVEFTIMSARTTGSSMFKWTKEGNVEIIESPFSQGAISEILERGEDDSDELFLDGPEAELIAAEESCSGGTCTLPATQHLQVRVGYDDSFKDKVGGTSQAEAYIAACWPHIQVSYCHASLGSRVVVEMVPGIKHYAGKNLVASGAKLQEMFTDTANDLGSADLMLYMAADTDYYGTVGIAWCPVVCDPSQYNKYKSSINEWRQTHAASAHVMAHEMGHNLGMRHDFIDEHKASGCDGAGIMSYGNPPNQWSTCSVADFTAQYKVRQSSWCLPAAPSACGGSGGTPTPAPTTAAPTPAPATCTGNLNWIGDDYCDDELNNAACEFDKGDCCNNSKPNWDHYCTVCQCLQTGSTTAPCTGNKNWIGDNYCDDELNNVQCEFDKGDCCNNSMSGWDTYCTVCQCLN